MGGRLDTQDMGGRGEHTLERPKKAPKNLFLGVNLVFLGGGMIDFVNFVPPPGHGAACWQRWGRPPSVCWMKMSCCWLRAQRAC